MLDFANLNPDQQAAIAHSAGPAIVLAGAGSGKTTVLTHRALYLLDNKSVTPQELLVVTFTNKAAQEIRQRISAQSGLDLPYVGTFHSFAARLLRQYGPKIGLFVGFSIYDADDQKALIKSIIKDLDLKPAISVGAAQYTISRAKNDLISVEQYGQIARGNYQQKIHRIYQLYQRKLREAQAVDFDDLLILGLKLVQEVDAVREKLQQQFQHILIDEYQDTNLPQYLLSTQLASPQEQLFVVGDFSQSIYAWRGADYRNMLKLYEQFPDIKEYKLEQNYRSNQTILDAATQVIAQNRSHPILKLWTKKTNSRLIEVIDTQTAEEEASRLALVIEKAKRAGLKYEDMAILYRTNAQSRPFEEVLMRNKIPYSIIGGVGFYERKEIKDVLAYLRLIVNPNDEVARQRVEKLGKRRMSQFESWLEKERFDQLAPVQIIEKLFEVTGYLEKFQSDDPADQARLENINELESVAAQFTALGQFLENVALVQNNTLLESKIKQKGEGVQLMTLHSAKGLEFELVCLAGMEEGLLPHSSSFMDAAELEEERRLCYVGITRAKDRLVLSFARSRFLRGSRLNSFPSRFLEEIDPSLLDSPLHQKKTPTRRMVPDEVILDQILENEVDVDALIEW